MRRLSLFVSLVVAGTLALTTLQVSAGTTNTVLTGYSIAADLLSTPPQPGLAQAMRTEPVPQTSYPALIALSPSQMARWNAETAAALHVAGLAAHSQHRTLTRT